MKYKLLLLLVLLAGLLSANSVFAPLGMPIELNGNDVYGLGMGDTGISDLNRLNNNQENPSLMTTLNKVTVSTAVNMGYYWYKDDQNSFREDELYLPYFTLSIPVQSHRLGISLNAVASGNLFTGQENVSETGGDSLAYHEIVRKTEDLFKTSLHYAFKNKIVNIGVSASYYFGNKFNYWSLDFDDSSYNDTKYEYESIYSGVNYKLGISRQIGNFSIGAAWEPSAELKGSRYFCYNFEPEIDTLSTDDEIYTVPEKLGAGFTWLLTNTFRLSMEGDITRWADTDGVYIDENNNEYTLDDSWRMGLGFSYDPVIGYGKWYESIPVRFGFGYKKAAFKSNDNELTEISATIGSTIQLDSPGRKLDLAVRFVNRGDVDDNGYQDQSLQLIIGVTGFDIFKKQLKRTDEREIPKVTPGMEVREDKL